MFLILKIYLKDKTLCAPVGAKLSINFSSSRAA